MFALNFPSLDVYIATFFPEIIHGILSDFRIFSIISFLIGIICCVEYLLAVPAGLRHLPKVSPYATIWSYARRESVDSRVRRLILPFAGRGEGVVLVYMLGKWGLHVLDANVRSLLKSRFLTHGEVL